MTRSDLETLSRLLHQKHELDARIAAIVGRPAQIGHVGEFIASKIFAIDLHASASHKGSDGLFREGPLAGQSVNVKWYAKHENVLDISLGAVPDYYLVMTGPTPVVWTSRGGNRPWLIEQVFLFDAAALIADLQALGVKVGVASGVRKATWSAAELFPTAASPLLTFSPEQRHVLSLFGANGAPAP
ncbi:MAG: hypothetical protein EPO22_09025 [Dehalococcoidia bacterium]|nr:MAG: hypothetical protein EPO22_09025 [Dehalococcoidia bacterium]